MSKAELKQIRARARQAAFTLRGLYHDIAELNWPEPGAPPAPEPVPEPLPLPAELGAHARVQLVDSFNEAVGLAIGFLDRDDHCLLGALVQMRGRFQIPLRRVAPGPWLNSIKALRQSGLVEHPSSSGGVYYSFDPRRCDLRFIRWEVPGLDLDARLVADAYRAAARATELMREHD